MCDCALTHTHTLTKKESIIFCFKKAPVQTVERHWRGVKMRLFESLIRVHLWSGSEVDHDKKGDFISLLYFSRWAVVIKRERERRQQHEHDSNILIEPKLLSCPQPTLYNCIKSNDGFGEKIKERERGRAVLKHIDGCVFYFQSIRLFFRHGSFFFHF